nr:hypothetical protein [uncultured Noviherbaspirillum sp.]
MRSWTGIEIEAEHERLEREAASILGYMLFEYSRLDMELGMMVVWAGDGQQLEKLTTEYNQSNFNKKLRQLERQAASKYAALPEAFTAHTRWLDAADRMRECRNKLVHGRWGVEPTRQQVVNVVGLPTSPEQKAIPYTIPALQAELDAVRSLRTDLAALRKAWPL